MKTFTTAAEAIEHSRQYDEITACEDTQQNRSDLWFESDGNGDINDGHEYWGNDDRPAKQCGMAWRVQVINK